MRVCYVTDNEMRVCLAWLSGLMAEPDKRTVEGELLLEILEAASELEHKPIASRRASNVVEMSEWRAS